MHRQLRKALDAVKPEVIRCTEELIQSPSVSLSEVKVAARIESLLHELGYNLVFSDDVGNVVGVLLQSEPEPSILLNSHMDTVELDASSGWKREPFGAEVESGRMFGLGAADCKSGLVAQMFAGHILNQTTLPLKGNIIFAATVAEENGCSLGLKHLLETTLPQIDMKPSIAILGEPTGLQLCYGHDGWIEVGVRIEGPTNGVVEDAARLIARSLQCAPGKPYLADDGRVIMSVQPPRYEETRRGPVAILRVSRRLYTGESASGFISWMQQRAMVTVATAGLPSVGIDVRAWQEPQRLYTGRVQEVVRSVPPWSTGLLEPMVDRARECLTAAGCSCVPTTWRLDRLGMGTGGSHLCDHGIPTLGFGPGEEAQAHAPDEYVEIDKLFEAVYGTAVLAHRFIGAPAIGVA